MLVEDFPRIRLLQPTYLLLELLVKLFTLGIFSVEGGAKAWFELVLVVAALCASGYILWWQIPLLIAAIILGTLSAGIFSVVAPQYLEIKNLEADKQVAVTLQTISKYNLNQISTLSSDKLRQRLEQIYKAKQIFEDNPRIVEQISEFQSIFNNVNQACDIVEDLENQRKEFESRRQQEEAERKRKEWEAYQRELNRSAQLKARQERFRQAAKKKEEQEEIESKKRWIAWLNEQRKRERFTGGCPPDNRYNPPRCRPGYPIKVTLNKKEDGFDGIIWKPSDTRYASIVPKWCYTSVQEAEAERGKYRFRRPKNRRKT